MYIQIYECSFDRRYRKFVLCGEEMGIWIRVSQPHPADCFGAYCKWAFEDDFQAYLNEDERHPEENCKRIRQEPASRVSRYVVMSP